MNLQKLEKKLESLTEDGLFKILKKLYHESNRVEFKSYFNVKDDLWQTKADEIVIYIAGLANAGGGTLFLGVPVDKSSNFDFQKWNTDRPIEAIDPDHLNILLSNRLPENYRDRYKLKVIPSDLFLGFCRIVILAPKGEQLIWIKSNKLNKKTIQKKNSFKGVNSIFIPLKTKTSLVDYTSKKKLYPVSPYSRKQILTFEDKTQILIDFIEEQILDNEEVSLAKIQDFFKDTKLHKTKDDTVNLVYFILKNSKYIIKQPGFGDNFGPIDIGIWNYGSNYLSKGIVKDLFSNPVDVYLIKEDNKEYQKYLKKEEDERLRWN